MTSGHLVAMLRHLRTLAGVRQSAELSDRHLLERFTLDRDETAFAALLRRHGGMVWSVCRRVLADPADADDAFQATFLVLLHKAASLHGRESLAGWLQGVAWRLARKVKAEAMRRQMKEGRAERKEEMDFTADMDRRDLRGLLDEELDRLPEKYRAPVVLCYLEGLSYTEAARQLGWRDGTVCGRLARARELLRKRLTRRGLTLTGAALVAVLSEQATAPAATTAATTRMAALFGLGQTVAGAVSPPVATLAQSVVQAMNMAKLKALAMVVVALGVLATGAGLAAPHFLGHKPPPPETTSSAVPEKPKSEKAERKDLFGDPLPPDALVRIGTVRFRHPNLIGNVAYSRDGKILAAAGFGGIIRHYDPATGKTLRQLQAQARQYPAITFAPDGKTLACLGTNIIHLWDMTSGKELRHFGVQASADDSHYWTVPVAFSADGRLLASAARDHSVRVWEIKTGKELVQLRGHQDRVACLAFSADGKTLFSASDRSGEQGGSVHVWSVSTGEVLKKLSLHRSGETVPPTPLSFSPDGKTLALASWQTLERKHAKGRTIMQAHAVALLDLETGKVRRKFEPMVGRFKAASFSADGKIIAAMNDEWRVGSGTTQEDVSRIKGWETDTGKKVFDLPAPPTSTSFWGGAGTLLAFAPDGKRLAVAADSSLHVWDLQQGREQDAKPNLHHGQVACVAFSPDGRTLASASSDHTIALWGAATGKQLQRLRGHEGEVSRLRFSPDGKLLASASQHLEQSVRLWDVATGKEIRRHEVPHLPTGDGGGWAIVTWIAFTENGKVLAACGSDGTLRRWDTATGKEVFHQRIRGLPALPKGHEAHVYFTHDPVFSSDGRVLALSILKTIYIVDVAGGQVLFSYENDAFFNSVLALSPDGKTLLRRVGNYARLVEVASGRDVRALDLSEPAATAPLSPEGRRIIAQPITAAAFSPDGRIIAVSAGEAHASIRLLDVATGKELLRLQGHEAHVPSLAFSPDGTKLASGQWDTTALIWDVSATRRQLPRKDLTPHDLERLWTELRDTDAAKAHAALWTLVAAPEKAVPFLKEHLHPVPRVAADRLRRLIADLDADDFARRDEASRNLAKLGSEAEPALRQALQEKPALEKRRRLEALLDGLACQTEMTPDALRQLRAIQVLEQIGSPAARQILVTLAQGAPAAPATRAAAAGLARLNRRASSR